MLKFFKIYIFKKLVEKYGFKKIFRKKLLPHPGGLALHQ
jgi:hypothetical protein